MAHVSLIVTTSREGPPYAADVGPARHALEAAGYTVEVVVPHAPAAGPVGDAPRADRGAGGSGDVVEIVPAEPGRAAAAIAGLQAARGELLLVLDLDRGYAPTEMLRVLEALDPSRVEVVVASRLAQQDGITPVVLPKALLGKLLRRFTGSSDPLSGLVGLTRPALNSALPGIQAVGSQFTMELLAKVRGRRVDVPARPLRERRHRRPPGFDDVRHLKHLADYRFGNASRLMQFCAVGASGMVVDLTAYALLQEVLFQFPALADHAVPPTRVPWALALARALAIGVALIWNFSLNRRMTFSYARGGSILRQFVAYVLSNLLGVTVSMLLSLGLPSRVAFFHDHKLVAALVGIVAATGISFSLSRWLVFRGVGASTSPPIEAPKAGTGRPTPHDSALAQSTTAP